MAWTNEKAKLYQRRRRASDPAIRERDRQRMREHYHKKCAEDPTFRARENARLRKYTRSTPLEIAVENYLRDRILALDGLCMKFIDPGQRGAPDRLIVLHGRPTYYVELKRPRMSKLSEHQKRYHERLRERGQRVWVLWSKEDVDAFLNEITLT